MRCLTKSWKPKLKRPVDIPYNDLHIYYLRGWVANVPDGLGPEFIGNWQESDAAFLFFTRPAESRVNALLRRQPELTLVDTFHMSYADWHGGEIKPFVTDRFYVAPPWAAPGRADDRLPILLDPGVVFGAGTHPTTQSCLEALEIVWQQGGAGSALDLGTGTGLLALAAARLGCCRVLAVDNNGLAVRTTRENIRANRLDSRVLAVIADARDLMACPVDLVMANIHFDIMRHLLACPEFYEKKWFILSGLLRSQARQVEEMIHYGPGRIVQRWINDGVWYTFLGACTG